MQNRKLVAVMKREQRIKNLRERRRVCCIPSNVLNNDGRVPPSSKAPSSSSSATIEVIGGQQREDEVSHNFEARDIQNSRLGTLLGSTSPGSPHTDITLYTGTIDSNCRPHALCRSKPSRFSYALLYALIVVGLWILTVCIPFYAWLVLIILVYFLLSTALKMANAVEAEAVMSGRRCSRSHYQEIILAPEKYPGFYMGILVTCFLFWLLSLRVGILQDFESMNDPDSGSLYVNSLLNSLTPPLGDAFLNIGGLSSATDDFGLFIAVIVSLVVGAVLWSQLVWISTDPGGIYTREQDFYVIMDQCFTTLGAASSQLFCRTTLVKKPLRSKYCVQTGLVIARMDHHCMWLNNTVGYGNHRTFIMFLIFNLSATSLYTVMLIRALNREINYNNSQACIAVGRILGREYFFSLALCAFLSVVSLGLSALLIEQCINISKNITTNERLNRSRYPWMNDSLGKPFNHFDKGLFKNTLEFWRFPGYEKDYYQEFCLPSVERKNEKVMDSTINDDNNAIKRPSINDNRGGDQISGINPSPGSEAGRQLHQSSPPPLNTSPRDINMASPFPTSRKPSIHSRQLNSNPESRQFYSNSEPPPFPNTESKSQDPLDHQKEERRDSQDPLIGYQAQNSIYLRQLEAQAQFEVRVQQAIDISNRQPYLNNVSGGSPVEVDLLQGNGNTDWNGISRVNRHSQSSRIHTDLESNMSRMSSTENDYSTVNNESKLSNHDKIPHPSI
mmetsp:Transcript_34523/g.32890  ORF Transcript_34523/g.32890 Transcript_34523/m.32890 type:complete len:730 (+) Transcript_34523:362-2551(+)